jgi:hypothetical protein
VTVGRRASKCDRCGKQHVSAPSAAPLLRGVIDIPERTSTSDFVLRLADAETTMRDYVVTERLVGNFDEALGLIRSAVEGHASKAAYLHGSFGSGKSHLMAVLHTLLRGEAAACGRDEIAPLVAKHSVWPDGRKFLLIPYHLLDARSLEQRVLGVTSTACASYIPTPRSRRRTAPMRCWSRPPTCGSGSATHSSSTGCPVVTRGRAGRQRDVLDLRAA